MTCEACKTKVQDVLHAVDGVSAVKIDLERAEADITMTKHVDTSVFQHALKPYPKYQLSEKREFNLQTNAEEVEHRSWFQIYKPVLLIFSFITAITLLIQVKNPDFDLMQWMSHFMAGFFLTFSFFKLLNLQGFADSYSTYDIIAKRWRFYGFLYAFIELGLGISYLLGSFPMLTNLVTFGVMSVSLVGVLQSVLNKKKIRCACLGDVFNLPMSTITIFEDILMILMSAVMLIKLI